MPAVSRQQQKWAFAVKGPAWAKAHHFDQLDVAKAASSKLKKRRKR